jgi:hypothetical protein
LEQTEAISCRFKKFISALLVIGNPEQPLSSNHFSFLGVKSKSSFVRVPFEEVGKRTPSKGGY